MGIDDAWMAGDANVTSYDVAAETENLVMTRAGVANAAGTR